MKPPAPVRKNHRQAIGRWGEDLAAQFLSARGYEMVARNVRTPFGEIDLIARCGGMTVFVEVKTRSSIFGGDPESAVTMQKQEHLLAAIDEYLASQSGESGEWRVDVIAVTGRPGRGEPNIVWFEDALA